MAKVIRYSIYSFYTLDNKIYIGMTKNPQVRIQQHHYKSCNYRLRKLLADTTTVVYSDILYTDLSCEEANQIEKRLIKQYRNDPNYEILNIQSGGLRGNNKCSQEPEILKNKNFLSNEEILEIRNKYSRFRVKIDFIKEAAKYSLKPKYFFAVLRGNDRKAAKGPLLGKDYKWLK